MRMPRMRQIRKLEIISFLMGVNIAFLFFSTSYLAFGGRAFAAMFYAFAVLVTMSVSGKCEAHIRAASA